MVLPTLDANPLMRFRCRSPDGLRLLRFQTTVAVINSFRSTSSDSGTKGERIMKKLLSVFALVLGLVTVSYAAAQHSASVTLYETVYVGSDSLPAGDYSLHWPDGPGVVQLSITGYKHNLSV